MHPSILQVTQQAYFFCASYYTFSSGDGDIIPIVTELWSDPNDELAPVTFKYISDFTYMPADYTIDAGPCVFPVGIDNRSAEASISVFPNPVTDIGVMMVNMTRGGNVIISMSNMLGQTVMNLDPGYVVAGNQQFTLDASNVHSGIYFATIQINGEKYSRKVVIE